MSDHSTVETWQERTGLAWQRTGLGMFALAALLARASVEGRTPALLTAAGVVALFGLGVLGWLAPRRERAVQRALAHGTGVAAPRQALLATAAVVAVGVVALVAVLSPR